VGSVITSALIAPEGAHDQEI